MLYRLMFTVHEPFQLPSQERERLQQIVRTTTLSAGLVRRARVLLLLAEGVSLRQIQAQTGMSPRRIQHWKRSWRKKGLDGLLDAPRAGRPKKLTVAKEAAILAATEEHPGIHHALVHAPAGSTIGREQRHGHARMAQGRTATSSAAAVHGQPGPAF